MDNTFMTDMIRFYRFRAFLVLTGAICLTAFWIGNVNVTSQVSVSTADPEFWTEITGSDKDGFDLYAKNSDEQEKRCTVKVSVSLSDGGSKSYEYSGTVRKTDKMWFGGEAGLKPGPIRSVDISSRSCS